MNASSKILSVTVMLALLTGCSTVGYYSQIISGHMRIVIGKRPVDEIVADANVNDKIKHRLQVAQEARQFAIDNLELPDNNSYTSFYDTGRGYVTWNVVAVDEFSFNPKKWCFPIAGCVSYRGYYAEQDAQRYADALQEEGLDVSVNGATAYSTLGWFKDPLLNTMLSRSDPAIAALLFHELAHQQLYVTNDSKFNESFASFVEREGLKRWQENETRKNPQQDHSRMTAELDARKARQKDFIDLLRGTRDDLAELYETDVEVEVMRKMKKQRFEKMQEEYEQLKVAWNGYGGYDNWFSRELNNARLASIATYTDYVPAFQVLFEQSGGSFEKFYSATQEIADLQPEERTTVMDKLVASVQPSGASQ